MARKPMVVVAEEGMRAYTSYLSQEAATEYKYLVNTAHELRAALAPHSRLRALLVSGQVAISAAIMRKVMGLAVDAYGRFMQAFGEDLVFAERGRSGSAVPGQVPGPRGAMAFGPVHRPPTQQQQRQAAMNLGGK
jgi:hypothetical protein